MTIKIWDNIAGWVSQKSLKIYNGTAWATAKKGWIYGVKPGDPAPLWHQFYPEYPVNTASPSISGNTAAGSVLSCSTGTWTSTDAYVPTSYSYQWKKAGVDISNQVLSTYTTVSGDVGSAITCSVTATNERGNTTVASSNSITVTSSSYTVTWNANGGSVSPPSSSVTAGSSVTAPLPTRSGYSFDGWFTSASGGTKVATDGGPYTPTSDITLYAQWTLIQYTVTWNANGGSVSPPSSTVNAGSAINPTPTPTRANYTFNGWYNAASGGSLITTGGASYTPTSSITLYAQWTLIQYTVTWNANGGSVSPPSSTVNAGSAINPTPTPTRTGYTFNGWYNATSGGSLITTGGASYTPTSSTTLYAQWTALTYTVSYNANGGTGAPSSQTKTHDIALTLSSTQPTRSGYTFSGWNTASNGSGTPYSSGGSYTTNASATLFAQWTIIQYTVTWNANGGSVSPPSSTVNAGSAINPTPTPTRSGYNFVEWRDVSFGDPTITIAPGASYTPSYNITFYARWTAAAATAPTTPTNGGGTFTSGTNYVTNATFTSSSAGTTPITYYWTVSSSTSSSGPWSQRNTGNFSSSSLSTTLSIPQQSWVQATYGNWSRYTVYASNSAGNSGTLTWTI